MIQRPMACWLDQASSNTELCDAIDAIMKQDHEDVLLDQTLAPETHLDLTLDSFPDLLDNQSNLSATNRVIVPPISPPVSTTTSDYSSSQNRYEMPNKSRSTFTINNSQTNSNASNYSALGISPQFTTLSIHQHQNSFSSPTQEVNPSFKFLSKFSPLSMVINTKTNLHPPPYVQQQNDADRDGSYGINMPMNNGQSDVKRFRSASMNEGASQQQTRLEPQLLDPYRIRSSTYVEPSYYYNNKASSPSNATITTTSTSSVSADISPNKAWPGVNCPRPPSNSFSEVIDHRRQQATSRLPNNLSASYEGSSPLYSLNHLSNQGFSSDLTFQTQSTTNCTLYSLNQPSPTPTSSSLVRKTTSLIGFPVDEIKTDPTSPICTIEQQSEPDLWSDIEQNSSDFFHDNDDDEITSDDERATTVSTGFNADLTATQSALNHLNSASPFWQYNVQAKGPKTKRILYLKERDPHLSREFSDPVYQIKLSQTRGQTLTKLRKGDGNDVTPNPMKLFQLGKQIRDLSAIVGKANSHPSSVYHGIYHFESQANANDSAEVKKEKNKIASRACRLRKKAQHEANKLKLHGLNEEHKTLMELIRSIKCLILKRYHDGQFICSTSSNESLEAICSQMIASKYNHSVAGNTDGFVQGIINEMENS